MPISPVNFIYYTSCAKSQLRNVLWAALYSSDLCETQRTGIYRGIALKLLYFSVRTFWVVKALKPGVHLVS